MKKLDKDLILAVLFPPLIGFRSGVLPGCFTTVLWLYGLVPGIAAGVYYWQEQKGSNSAKSAV